MDSGLLGDELEHGRAACLMPQDRPGVLNRHPAGRNDLQDADDDFERGLLPVLPRRAPMDTARSTVRRIDSAGAMGREILIRAMWRPRERSLCAAWRVRAH